MKKCRTRKELFLKVLNKYTTLQKEICSRYTFLRDHNVQALIQNESEELWDNWKKIERGEIPNEETCPWIECENGFYTDCRHEADYDPLWVYCPFCGRKISG